MERLTFEGDFCDIAMCLETRGGSFCEEGACSQRRVWERLKHYEDLEEQGRLVVLPCKAGDTVYDIYEAKANGDGEIRALKVTDIHIRLDKRNKEWIIICGYYFDLADFGKTVFLTREEAEAALKGA